MGLTRSLLRGDQAEYVPARAGFAGAEVSRLTADWIWGILSANQEIESDLLILRARARELVRNTSWARRYATHLANNVIGHKGIRLQAKLRLDGRSYDVANERVERHWREWNRPENASTDGRLSWLDIQRLALKGMPGDGEFLVRMIYGFDNPYGFALQILDPDQLDQSYNQPRDVRRGHNRITMGVEVNDWDRPIFYHIFVDHPSELATRDNRERVPASEIIHLGDPYRPNQTRYVPWLASVMLDLNMLRGYFEAELVAARVAASKGGFFTRERDDMTLGPEKEKPKKLKMEAEPGLAEELPPGVKFEAWDPTHPTEAFDAFVKSILRSIASGLGVSYSGLTQDLRDVNFSSIRAGLLDERDTFRSLQTWLIDHLHARVYREWLRMALLSGQLDARVEPMRYLEVEWQPRGWPWVDPLKDAQTAELMISLGLGSRRRFAAEQGHDLEELFDDLRDEQESAAAKGVKITGKEKSNADGFGGNGRRPDAQQALDRLAALSAHLEE